MCGCHVKGKVLFVEDAEAMLSKHYGADATVKIERTFFQDNMVRPRNFLTRMLTNLKQIYFNEKNYDLALQVTEYQQETAPTEEVANFNRRDKGILFYLMQRYPEATIELQEYLKVCHPRTSSYHTFGPNSLVPPGSELLSPT